MPVAKNFDGLCLNKQWWEELEEEIAKLDEQRSQFFKTFMEEKPSLLDKDKVESLNNWCSDLFRALSEWLSQKDARFKVQDVRELVGNISEYYDALYGGSYLEKVQGNKDYEAESSVFHSFFAELREFSRFLENRKIKAAEIKAVFLYGEAGIGKSHLLCDISLHRIEKSLPTVFLLGSQYGGGNPVELIKDAVDLKGYRDTQVLGAIDAAGEASSSRALIVIDAINEGLGRDDWHNHIRSLLAEVSRFNHIAILFSCRSTYLRYILPDSINEDCLVKIQHLGFQGYEHRAAEKYLSKEALIN